MTDLDRTMRLEDAELIRREAEIQGMNGVLEIDGNFPLVLFREPSRSLGRLDSEPKQRLRAA
jgi:hypothetical protein